jgi:hypothetical protein
MDVRGANSADVIERYFHRGIDLYKSGKFYLSCFCFSRLRLVLLSFLSENSDVGNFRFDIYFIYFSGFCFYHLEQFHNKLFDNSHKSRI